MQSSKLKVHRSKLKVLAKVQKNLLSPHIFPNNLADLDKFDYFCMRL